MELRELLYWIFSLIEVKLNALVCGILGALASFGKSNEHLSFRRKTTAIITGAVVAGIFTPIFEEYYKLSSSMAGGVAFGLGLLAMPIIGGLVNLGQKFNYDPIAFALSISDAVRIFIKNKFK